MDKDLSESQPEGKFTNLEPFIDVDQNILKNITWLVMFFCFFYQFFTGNDSQKVFKSS